MSFSIKPDIDAYGGDSRTSALADVLEVQAIVSGHSMSEAQLEDFIADSGWGRRWADKFHDVGESGDAEGPTAAEHAQRAINHIFHRAGLLGEAYPFSLATDSGVVTRTTTTACSYDLLLALSVSHAYALNFGVDPKSYFEAIVVRAFQASGIRATGVGALRAKGLTGDALIEKACALVGLRPTMLAARRRAKSFDGGVDVVAHVCFPPVRLTTWCAVCQATCGKSETWEEKLGQTAPSRWRKLLNSEAKPMGVLAVPYYVDDKHLAYVEEGREGMVLDRLAWTLSLSEALSDDDVKLARCVKDCSVDVPYRRSL